MADLIPRFLVARADGTACRIVQARTGERAIEARLEDDGDDLMPGELVCVWRLGNFPEHYEAGVRSFGNQRVRA